jgi:hypothetical protein
VGWCLVGLSLVRLGGVVFGWLGLVRLGGVGWCLVGLGLVRLGGVVFGWVKFG